MESEKSRLLMRILAATVFITLFGLGVVAQDDPDPNSPTPILLNAKDPARALAISQDDRGRVNASRITAGAFEPNSKVVLFVTNMKLMSDEGANAIRVYVEDAGGRLYRFPVVEVAPDTSPYARKGVFAVTILTTDELGYWDEPTKGDVLVQIAWRGLGSNRLRLGYGETGGSIKDDPISSRISASSGRNNINAKPASPEYVGYKWSGDRMRFLEQATFGPTAALDSRIRRIGLKAWLSEQFAAPYASVLPDCPNGLTDTMAYPCQPLKPANAPTNCDNDQIVVPDVPVTCFRDTYTLYPLQTWFMKYALYGDAQLRHRVAWALQELDVTSGVDVQQSRHMVEYHKILSNNAFGNYRTILGQITLHPTMGDYLSMSLSTKNNPNENYAREIMQLFSVGLFMLNQDGTLQLDGTGNPIPTYDQNNVNNLTKVLTGWTFCQTVGSACPNVTVGTVNYIDPMLLNTNNTDLTAKTLLSYPGSTTTNIAACGNCTTAANITTYANASMNQALDNIYNHPNVGPFVCKTLIQQMVTSDPTPAYVGRVVAVFNANRASPTQLKEVINAILLDPEARGDLKTDPGFGKLREPVQLATNFLRTFNVRSADGTAQSDGYLMGRGEFTGMAQIPFLSPTVFNYYPPSYVIPGTATLGPEFAIMNTGTAVQRANFVNQFTFAAIPVTVSNPNAPNGTSLDFSDLQALSTADSTGNLLVDEIGRRMLHGTMTQAMKNAILPVVTAVAATDSLNRVRQAIYLTATSSQYQVQR